MHHSLSLSLLFLIATASSATVCPSSSPSFPLYSSSDLRSADDPPIDTVCCSLPITFTRRARASCRTTVSRSTTDESGKSDRYVYTCTFTASNTFTIAKGTVLNRLEFNLLGGRGGTVQTEDSRTTAEPVHNFWVRDLSIPQGVLEEDRELAVWVNAYDQSRLTSDYGAGGGGYSAYGNADCFRTHPEMVFPDENGVDCRIFTAGGGGGSAPGVQGPTDGVDGEQGNSESIVRAGSQATSLAMEPYFDANGVMSGGGGGGGYRGGAAPRPFADSTDTVTGSGAGGSSGGDDPSLFRIIQQSQRSGLPAQVVVTLSTFGAPCEAAVEPAEEGEGGDEGEGEPDTTETKVETTTVEETKYVETVFTPDATVTQAPKSTVTVTATPETVPETEYEVSKVTLPAETFTEEVYGGVTTPATSTVRITTDVTNTPAPATVTMTTTPAVATVYKTSTSTVTPPVSTYTAVKSVATGNAACTTYRLVYPVTCCPNTYVQLTPRPSAKRRFARSFGKTQHEFAKRAVVTTTETQTETRTVEGTQTLPGKAVTVTETVTTTEEQPASTTTVTETQTAFVDQPRLVVTATYYSEAPTPLLTETATSTHQAPTPTQTITETPAGATTTVTVYTNTTLAQQTTTTTSTAYSQATTCASKTVYTQSACPLPLLKGLDQIGQLATLNLWKAAAKNQPVIVFCGSAGSFTY